MRLRRVPGPSDRLRIVWSPFRWKGPPVVDVRRVPKKGLPRTKVLAHIRTRQVSADFPVGARHGLHKIGMGSGYGHHAPMECASTRHPHLESPQLRQVMQPSSWMTAFVLHFAHSVEDAGNSESSAAETTALRVSSSLRLSAMSLR